MDDLNETPTPEETPETEAPTEETPEAPTDDAAEKTGGLEEGDETEEGESTL